MASDLLTVPQAREHVQTGLTDSALERVIDGEDAYIRRQVGEHDPSGALTHEEEEPGEYVNLPRPAASVSSVSIEYFLGGAYTVPTSYYRLTNGGRTVRLIYPYIFDLGSQYSRAVITYDPEPENAERRAALIELVRLAVQDTGLAEERDDTYNYTAKDRLMARKQIIAPLRHMYLGAGWEHDLQPPHTQRDGGAGAS